jgi:AraC-like DNA-binding protein
VDEPFLYRAWPPPPELEDLVGAIWVARGRIGYGRERILPSPDPVLIVNLGSAFLLQAARSGDVVMREGWLVGPQTGYVENVPLAETNVVGATLRPWGASSFFALPADDLADRIVDLASLWGAGFGALRERLAERPDPSSQRSVLAAALLARRIDGPPTAVALAAGHLATGRTGVSAVAGTLSMSRKHLDHLFSRHIGLSPKVYARLHRFERVLRDLAAPTPPPLAAVAHEHGYYDQAHLNRDFLAFARVTPTEYLRLRSTHLAIDEDESGRFVPGI